MAHTNNDFLLEISKLKTCFFTEEGIVKAVYGIDLHVKRGQGQCLVGKFGYGKTETMQRSIELLQLVEIPNAEKKFVGIIAGQTKPVCPAV